MDKDTALEFIRKLSEEHHFDSFYNINYVKKLIDDLIIETRRRKMNTDEINTILIKVSAMCLSYVEMVDNANEVEE